MLSRQFDLGGRLAAQSAGSLQQLGWTYDDAGNITGLNDAAQPGRSQTFDHDALDRLTEASGAYGTQQFDYDAAGNRLSLTDDSAITSYTYATASNRLLTAGPASYQYDANGNTTADGTDVFTFNQANRLATVTRAGQPVATYTYNALGQRVRKDASLPSAVQTLFVYDLAGHLIGEYAANGTMLVEHVWLEDMPLAQLRPDGTGGTTIHWYLTDHLDTPTQLTDENQQVVWDAVREPFGTTALVVSTVSNNLRFPGQYEDAETGQHYNYFRDYDPSTGRYVASDPIGLLAGLNTYSYAWETPLEVVDPKGLIGFALRNELRRGPHRIPTQDAIRISNNLSVIEAASTAAAAIAPIAAVAVVEGGAPLCAAAGAAAPRVAQACRHPVMAAVLGASICGNMAGTVSGTARNYARDRDRIQEIVNAATRTPRRNTGSASVPPP